MNIVFLHSNHLNASYETYKASFHFSSLRMPGPICFSTAGHVYKSVRTVNRVGTNVWNAQDSFEQLCPHRLQETNADGYDDL